jgi:alkanesulfonate monooxygenase SsuD/methylene tetrahydromethanopterin reductase-like flavin-dependent oxidoreductase (luciferase family)
VTDHGRPIEFGFFLIPEADDPARLLEETRLAERCGFDLVGVQDHPYHGRFLDAPTLIATLAARTERIGFFTAVANLPLRAPAVLAKAAASLDRLNPGRFHLGLGAGAMWDGIASIGGTRLSRREAVDSLSEAIDVIRLMWSGEPAVSYDGKFHRLDGVETGPQPGGNIGIWLGAYGPRMLALVGSKADGWMPSSPYVGPTDLPGVQARVDAAAAAVGRDPTSIRRIYNINGRITDGASEGPFTGPAQQWIDQLVALALDTGFDTFLLWPSEAPARQLERFAAEIMPEVQTVITKERH